MKKLLGNLLRTTLLLDFLITFGFGVVSFVSPMGTFGTLVSSDQMNTNLTLSLFASLSIFYTLTGLVCLAGFKGKFPFNVWIGAIMALRHGWIGGMGMVSLDSKNEWMIGSPNPDIIVHSIFLILYVIGGYYAIKQNK